ncbi:wax ester/triacylglycerol synthase domain-containing protein [Patulibacter sp. NPDC049589]|uniref:wax ester/triacylglycerol synthase domain-containing protein n=1 Tax=Patulibacter sp. NPDC049589 TaxID=3154731 RepID=UPI003413D59E
MTQEQSSVDENEAADWGTSDELTAFETMMWRADADPALRSAGLIVEVLDHAPDWDRLVTGHRWVVRRVRRMRQRVLEDRSRIGQPAWVDAEVDLNAHLRRVTLPPGSTFDDAMVVAAEVHMEGFERDRPQWKGVLVDGLADGRALYLFKLHHAMSDGTALIQLLHLIHSTTAEPTVSASDQADPSRAAVASAQALVVRNAARQVGRAPGLVARGGRIAGGVLRRPRRSALSTVRYVQSLGRMAGASPGTPSPALSERGLGRDVFAIDVAMADLRAAGKALGGSLNDAYLAALGAGLRRYHEALGVEVDEIPLGMPISLRKAGDEGGGNRFAAARVALPVAERDATARVARVRAQVLAARDEPALDLAGAAAPLLSRLPTGVLTRTTSTMTSALDVQASNFRGLTRAAYVAGAEVLEVYVMGPVPGCAIMATLISNRDRCSIGVAVDTAAVTDVPLLRRSIGEGLAEVVAAGAAG